MIQKELKEQGYTKEEEYFYNLNKTLIEKKRKEIDEQQHKQKSDELKNLHWMHCPKCGHKMEEIKYLGILLDRCGECHGVYFDKGELDTLLESKEQKGFLDGLKKLFK
ncbi:MAG: hypothetical protein EHM45_19385 [Desulfobacteraceae bacterium]|nr:MAG: hypothetical protein EHM45_19385 [Desulfobacteraceae bacterium]